MAYLKSLGVLRLVSQREPDARGYWANDVFTVLCAWDAEQLVRYFLHGYAPTPIVAPWNGGSGFYPGDNRQAIETIAQSDNDRLDPYRTALSVLRAPDGFLPSQKPEKDDKLALLRRCRAELPDEVVPWLDAAYVLASNNPKYPPLLGTGANDGRLEFTNNFMQRLVDMLPMQGDGPLPKQSEPLLRAALFGTSGATLIRAAVGQFHPGGAGGPNGSQGVEGVSLVNPWDYILMIEGALFCAGSAARRLGVDTREKASFPFTVTSSAVGYGTAVPGEETSDGSRAELWLPLWTRPASAAEIGHLFAEGRAQVGQRQARTGVDFARAVVSLGVNRGIEAFQRFAFLKRNGLAFLASPLGRFPVTPHPKARLLEDSELQPWLDAWRRVCGRKSVPSRFEAGLRAINRAVFEYTLRTQNEGADEAAALQEVIIALGRAERLLARAPNYHKAIRPLQGLDPRWWEACDDGSPVYRLAASLASIEPERDDAIGPLRIHLEPVSCRKSKVGWQDGSPSAVWGMGDVGANLRSVFLRRSVESVQLGLPGIALRSPRPVNLADVAYFLASDDAQNSARLWTRLTDLVWGLIGVARPSGADQVSERPADDDGLATAETSTTSVAFRVYSILKLFAPPVRLGARNGRWAIERDPSKGIVPRPDPNLFQRLNTGAVSSAEDASLTACRRLKASGLVPRGLAGAVNAIPREPFRVNSRTVLTALIFPISDDGVSTLANTVLSSPPDGR